LILALSHHDDALRQTAIEWGVTPTPIPEASDVEDLWAKSLDAARTGGFVAEGDLVVITAGTAVNLPGTTDVIKVDLA
jgi:pyruvate kinase